MTKTTTSERLDRFLADWEIKVRRGEVSAFDRLERLALQLYDEWIDRTPSTQSTSTVPSTVPESDRSKGTVWALYCENAGYGISQIDLYTTKQAAIDAEKNAREQGIEESWIQEVALP